MKLKRDMDQTPWTKDSVLRQYRFCNVFREDDKTTTWFRENIRDPLSSERNLIKLIIATAGFRWFNKIETGELIKDILLEHGWDSELVVNNLRDVSPVVTGAYIIKTPAGMKKLDGIAWCMKKLLESDIPLILSSTPNLNLQLACEMMQTLPYMGPFMSYEVVTDLRHTPVLNKADDILFWANPGPGCARGAGWIVDGNPELFSRHSRRDVKTLMWIMKELLSMTYYGGNWPKHWPRWEMRDVEHSLCELDKYCRAKINGQRLKRRYECSS